MIDFDLSFWLSRQGREEFEIRNFFLADKFSFQIVLLVIIVVSACQDYIPSYQCSSPENIDFGLFCVAYNQPDCSEGIRKWRRNLFENMTIDTRFFDDVGRRQLLALLLILVKMHRPFIFFLEEYFAAPRFLHQVLLQQLLKLLLGPAHE